MVAILFVRYSGVSVSPLMEVALGEAAVGEDGVRPLNCQVTSASMRLRTVSEHNSVNIWHMVY